MSTDDDMWDPNNWGPTNHEFRIYGDDTLLHYVIVDEIDYAWAVQWRWTFTTFGYLKRSSVEGSRSDGSRKWVSVYLHVEILRRMKKRQPTKRHTIGDHIDINPRNCRRSNLRWVTKGMNNSNTKRWDEARKRMKARGVKRKRRRKK
jgi:hypothetical protein